MIKYLYEQNVFKPNRYNNFDAYNDYKFMLNMFNQKNEPSEKQNGKINGLIAYNIKPYLKGILKFKKQA